MSFLYIPYFSQPVFFSTHHVTPHFVDAFLDLHKLQFFFFTFLYLLLSLSKTFINAYK